MCQIINSNHMNSKRLKASNLEQDLGTRKIIEQDFVVFFLLFRGPNR